MADSLNDLPFIDLYVRLDKPDQALYRARGFSLSRTNQPVPLEFEPIIRRFSTVIAEALRDQPESVCDFEGVRCRLSRMKMSSGTSWACARRINTVIPEIDNLNLTPHVVHSMKSLGKRDGLILISGSTGAGKTTTAVALLSHYLKTYGGLAVTIEDPTEYILEGRHGQTGHCFQIEIQNEEDYAMSIKRSLRWAPRYIFIGEIRTPDTAAQLLRAAITGHLVIATIHATTLEEGLMAILFLAEQSMGKGVQNILAAGLTAVIHQTMKDTKPWLRYLFTDPSGFGDPVRAIIRENNIGTLSTYIDRSEAKLLSNAQNPASAGRMPSPVGAVRTAGPAGSRPPEKPVSLRPPPEKIKKTVTDKTRRS